MRTIIAGSRTWISPRRLEWVVSICGWTPTVVISGGARGADQRGEQWAHKHGVPCERFLPDWETFGKSAGYKRNLQMAEAADALIALWDGKSRGTKHMIDIAREKNMTIYVHFLKEKR